MAGKLRLKKCLCIFTALLAAAMMVMPNALAFDTEQNQAQHSQLEQENRQKQNELVQTNMTIKEKEEYSQKLQKQISDLSKKIQQSNTKIKELNVQIDEKQVLIDAKLDQIQDRLDILRKRLRSIYTAGDISSLEIILQVKDFSDCIDKMELVQSISEYDNKLIQGLQAEMSVISDDQQKLKDDKQKVENEKKQLEDNKKKVNTLSADNQKLIEELKKTKNTKQEEIKENQNKQRELENALAKYNAEKAAELKAKRIQQEQLAKQRELQAQAAAKARANSGNNTTNNSASAKNNTSTNQNNSSSGGENNTEEILVESNGSYVWPCPGHTNLTSTFEEWRGAENHGALDIADGSVYGAAVVACWNGTVIQTNTTCTHDYGKSSSCGCGGGYGNYVMIDHGGGKVSIYGHLCEVVAEPGQEVTAGQLIGYVGSTGYSTGPHLHFEMQQDGVRYDPLIEY